MMYNKKEIETISNLSIIRGFAIADDNFEDGINSTLTLSTGWTVASDGIAISSSGGWGNSALYNKDTTVDRCAVRAVVEMTNATSVFSVMRKPVISSQFGSVIEVNGSTNSLNLYGSWDGSTTIPSVVKSVAIGFTIVAGQRYLLEYKKDKAKFTATFTSLTNPANTISLVYDNEIDTISGAGRMWSNPGVMFVSGSIKLKRFTYSTPFSNTPRVLITGHSFVEGYALVPHAATSQTYSNLLHVALGGQVAIAGRGGETSGSINNRNDISFFSPRYHMVDIGANDSIYATWLTNIQAYISKMVAANSIPILCTIVPRSGVQTFIDQANAWIRTSGYNYVDFAKAVTVGNDSVTQDSTLFESDLVHPNIAGNAKMFQQILSDAPYLFDGNLAVVATTVTEFPIVETLKTASFSVSAAERYTTYIINSTNPVTITVPTGLAAGLWWEFYNLNTGLVTFVAGSSATIISPDGRLKMRTQFSSARLFARASNQTCLGGDIVL